MKPKRPLLILALSSACAVPIVAGRTALPPLAPPALLPRSKEVARISSRRTFYAWQSNNTFLKFSIYPPSGMKQVNIRTGMESNLTRLQERLGEAGAFHRYVISPDGRKALWEDNIGERIGIRAAVLDSPLPIQSVPMSGRFWTTASNPIWMPDSKGWIQLFAATNGISAAVHTDGDVKADREINLGHPRGTSSGYDLMRTHLLGVTATGRVLATPAGADSYPNPDASRHIHFFEFSMDGITPNVRQYTIDLPKAEEGYTNNVAVAPDEEVELSPGGNQLAWLLHRYTDFPVQDRLSRSLPWIPSAPHLSTEIRVTNLDGTGSKILGTVAFKEKNGSRSDERPLDIHWLPDGQHISFVANGSLRVISLQPSSQP